MGEKDLSLCATVPTNVSLFDTFVAKFHHIMSPDSVSRSPSTASNWQELYKSAMLELDQNRVANRIAEARRAIQHRFKLVANSPENERGELSDALNNLDSLEAVVEREKSA